MVSSFMNLFSKNLLILTDKLSSYRIIWRIIYWRAEEGAGRIHQQVCKAKEIRDEKEFQKISPLAFLLLSSYSLCIDVGSVAIPWRRTRSHCTCFYKHRRSTKTMCQGKCARENERFVLVSGSFIYLLVQRGVRHPIPHPPLLPCLNWSRQWLFMLLKIKLGERLLCNPPSQHTHTHTHTQAQAQAHTRMHTRACTHAHTSLCLEKNTKSGDVWHVFFNLRTSICSAGFFAPHTLFLFLFISDGPHLFLYNVFQFPALFMALKPVLTDLSPRTLMVLVHHTLWDYPSLGLPLSLWIKGRG